MSHQLLNNGEQMKQFFLKTLKVFLIIAAILLVALLVFGIVLSLDLPWWVGFFILLGILGLWLGLLFLKKILLRRKEQHFVDQIIEQDDSYIKNMGNKEKERLGDLQARWKEAMKALKSSHLKKYGNPLYVLPWYMVIGESGSGKTTAIKSAGLSSPFADVGRTSGISGTRNCDWWFFEKSIIIDTAGRYAISVDEDRDKEEWQKFLMLLVKYRKKESLNGLIATVAADKLLSSDPKSIEENGRDIRRRIDELMRVLGTKFPVYILVTKCDLIQGMTQFCNHLPDKSLEQVMGYVNHDPSKNDVVAFIKNAMHTIGERLRDFRLVILHKIKSVNADPGILLFPEEFEKVKSGLDSFIKGAFRENPYQETPILRGLFFSSGRQEGSPYSHFLKSLGLIEERDVLPGTNDGLFLHDFFEQVLPTDRNLFVPTQKGIEWTMLTRNLGIASWVLVAVALCGLLSFSFVKNLKTMRGISDEFSEPLILQGEILTDVMAMDRFRKALLKVEKENSNWWIPRFWLNESNDIEFRLKEKYCEQFKDGFMVSFDQRMGDKIVNFSEFTSDEIISQNVVHLVRRINLLHTRLQTQDIEMLELMPQPSYNFANQKVLPEVRKSFADQYLYSLIWRIDSGSLNREMNNLQALLKHILTLKDADLKWLINWVNADGSLSNVSLEHFWGPSLDSSEVTVFPVFTLKGKERIDLFLDEIESALVDPLIIAAQKLEFKAWYRSAYFQAWRNFGIAFPKGATMLDGRKERRQMAAKMAIDQCPYFAVIDRITAELKPLSSESKNMPSWLERIYEFQAVRIKSNMLETKNKGALAKASNKGKSIISKFERTVSGADNKKALKSQLLSAKAFREYQNALIKVAPATASKTEAYNMTAQVYKEDHAISESPFVVANKAYNNLNISMSYNKFAEDDEIFWKLVRGPIDYLWDFVCAETACRLQNLWEKEVLTEIQGVFDQKTLNQILLGQDGYAMKFVNGPAKPFVSKNPRQGYYAKKALNKKMPFKSSFLSFLTKGGRTTTLLIKSNYTVSIKGLPTDANSQAKTRPHATRLELQCADKDQRLINFHYPVKKTFNWSSETCGDVVLQIEIGDLVLIKKYTGYQAFPKFLKDFVNGQRTFYPSEFPEYQTALNRLGVKYIKVNYQFRGHQPIIAILTTNPGKAPVNIIKCLE